MFNFFKKMTRNKKKTAALTIKLNTVSLNYTIDKIEIFKEPAEVTYELMMGDEVIESDTVQSFVVFVVLDGYGYGLEMQRREGEDWRISVYDELMTSWHEKPIVMQSVFDKLKQDILSHPSIRLKLLAAGIYSDK